MNDQLKLIASLRFHGVLRDLDRHTLPVDRGMRIVCCGDGHRFRDIFENSSGLIAGRCSDPNLGLHWVINNAGPLLLPKNSPLLLPGLPHDEVILNDLLEARVLGKGETVALCAHAPCGKVLHRMGALQSIAWYLDLLMGAKKRIKEAESGLKVKVACFIHLDYGALGDTDRPRMRTYSVSRVAWEHWLAHPELPHEAFETGDQPARTWSLVG